MITLTPRTRGATKSALVPLDQIDCPNNARPTHADKVAELVKSIQLIGLQSMPTVVERDGRYMLVAGRHRVEAMRVIGKDSIPVGVADFDDIEARLWAISENLHRNELSALERAEQVAEFARLSQEKADAAKVEHQAVQSQGEQGVQVGRASSAAPSEKVRQVGAVSGGRGNEGGSRVSGSTQAI
jgi:ParB-like chromosome segregation protein Spo0J